MADKAIVLVDDSRFELAVARDILEDAGYRAIVSTSGIEANQHIFANPPPDLIIIDLVMPMLKGDRKIRRLKQNRASRDIPVLLASSVSGDELKRAAEKSGADGYLPKPFRKETLLGKVKQFV